MKVCKVDGCGEAVKARGLCNKHYLGARRAGDLGLFEGPGRGRYAPETSRSCAGVSVCGKKAAARGLCNSCYQVRRKTGVLDRLPIINAGKTCGAEGCKNKAQGLGYCSTHYTRFIKYGDPLGIAEKKTGAPCSTKGCVGLTVARGMCSNCYQHFMKHGDPTKRSDWFNRRSEKIVDPKGYVLVYVGKHPNANRSSRVQEHRLVMSEFLGRPLRSNENVHHKNGNKADNGIENLELWVTAQPPGQRPLDLMKWARRVLKAYATDEPKLKRLEYRNSRQ